MNQDEGTSSELKEHRSSHVMRLKDNYASAFANKMSEGGATMQNHLNTVTINNPHGYFHDRKDSDTAFILVNGKLENIQSQRNKSL